MLSFVPFLPFFVFFVLFSKNPEFDFIIEQRKEKKYFSSVCLHVRKCVSPSVKARADFLDIFYFLSLKKNFILEARLSVQFAVLFVRMDEKARVLGGHIFCVVFRCGFSLIISSSSHWNIYLDLCLFGRCLDARGRHTIYFPSFPHLKQTNEYRKYLVGH